MLASSKLRQHSCVWGETMSIVKTSRFYVLGAWLNSCVCVCVYTCISNFRMEVLCVHMCLVQVLPVCIRWPHLGNAVLPAQEFVGIRGENIILAPPSLHPLILARRAPVWSVWQFLLNENNSKFKSRMMMNLTPFFSLHPLLIRMRWWTVRGDLVQYSAPILSLQIPAVLSVTPVCLRVLSTPTVTPSHPLQTPASVALVSEAPSPAYPWSAHKPLVSDQLPSKGSAVPSAQVLPELFVQMMYEDLCAIPIISLTQKL